MSSLAAIVLAAGRGTRLKSVKVNKVMRKLHGKPMIGYITETLKAAGINQTIVVVGFQKQGIMDYLGANYTYVVQQDTLGTGHAVKTALPAIENTIDHVCITYGDDSAFYPVSVFKQLFAHHQDAQADLTFLTVNKANPAGLGRILRDRQGRVVGIREEKNCTDLERAITEINCGCYIAKADFLRKAVPQIQEDPLKHEYYLTDIVAIGLSQGAVVEAMNYPEDSIHVGVNTAKELVRARRHMRKRQIR